MKKLQSNIPVLVSQVQECPHFATSLIDAVDYTWHVRFKNIPEQDPMLLLEDCPVVGDSAVELDGSALGKTKKFTIPPFSVLEILVLVRQALGRNDISLADICTLWSFFGGDPSCYRRLFDGNQLGLWVYHTDVTEFEAAEILLHEQARIRNIFTGDKAIFDLWKLMSTKARFQRQVSRAFSWLIEKGILTQQSFLVPSHAALYGFAPSFSHNGPSFFFGFFF